MRLAVIGVDDDVAWQQNAEIRLGLQRGAGELRVAGAENEVRLAVDPELLRSFRFAIAALARCACTSAGSV